MPARPISTAPPPMSGFHEWQKAVDDFTRYIELMPNDPDGYEQGPAR